MGGRNTDSAVVPDCDSCIKHVPVDMFDVLGVHDVDASVNAEICKIELSKFSGRSCLRTAAKVNATGSKFLPEFLRSCGGGGEAAPRQLNFGLGRVHIRDWQLHPVLIQYSFADFTQRMIVRFSLRGYVLATSEKWGGDERSWSITCRL